MDYHNIKTKDDLIKHLKALRNEEGNVSEVNESLDQLINSLINDNGDKGLSRYEKALPILKALKYFLLAKTDLPEAYQGFLEIIMNIRDVLNF